MAGMEAVRAAHKRQKHTSMSLSNLERLLRQLQPQLSTAALDHFLWRACIDLSDVSVCLTSLYDWLDDVNGAVGKQKHEAEWLRLDLGAVGKQNHQLCLDGKTPPNGQVFQPSPRGGDDIEKRIPNLDGAWKNSTEIEELKKRVADLEAPVTARPVQQTPFCSDEIEKRIQAQEQRIQALEIEKGILDQALEKLLAVPEAVEFEFEKLKKRITEVEAKIPSEVPKPTAADLEQAPEIEKRIQALEQRFAVPEALEFEKVKKRITELEAKAPSEHPKFEKLKTENLKKRIADVVADNARTDDSQLQDKPDIEVFLRTNDELLHESPKLCNIQDDNILYDVALNALKSQKQLKEQNSSPAVTQDQEKEPEPDYGQAWKEAGGSKASEKNAAWVKKEFSALQNKSCAFQCFARTLPEMYRKAKRAQQPFRAEVERLAKKTGGTPMSSPAPSQIQKNLSKKLSDGCITDTPSTSTVASHEKTPDAREVDFFQGLKGWSRALGKASVKYRDATGGVAWYRLTDLSRQTIIYDNWDKVYEAAKYIIEQKGDDVVEFTDRIPQGGKRRYADWLFLIRHNGFVHELQLNAWPMVTVKQGGGHVQYETQRFLDESCLDAASRDDFQEVANLFSQGANINATDSDGRTPLMRAAKLGHIRTMRLLLALGADVNTQDYGGNTALHITAKADFLQACWLLISEGKARTGQLNIDGHTPVEMVTSGHTKSFLVRYDNLHGEKLGTAIQNDKVEEVKKLLKDGATVAAAHTSATNGLSQQEPVWSFAAKAENKLIALEIMKSVLAAKACPVTGSAKQAGVLLKKAAHVALEAGNRETAELLAKNLRDAKLSDDDCPDYTKLLKLAMQSRPQEDCIRASKAMLNCARKEMTPTKLSNAVLVIQKLIWLCDEFGGPHDQSLAKELMNKFDVVNSAALLLRDIIKDPIFTAKARLDSENPSLWLPNLGGENSKEASQQGKLSTTLGWSTIKVTREECFEVISETVSFLQRAMVGNPTLRNTLREGDAPEYLLQAVEKYNVNHDDEKVKKVNQTAIHCLSQLNSGGSVSAVLKGKGGKGLEYVLATMDRYMDDPTISNFGTAVLRSIAEWEGRETLANNVNAVKVTLQSMTICCDPNNPFSPKTQANCMRILHNIALTTHRENLTKIDEFPHLLTSKELILRAMWRFPELEEQGQRILELLDQPRLHVLVDFIHTVVDLSTLVGDGPATVEQAAQSFESQDEFVVAFLKLEPVVNATLVLAELRERHDVFLVVPPKVEGKCIASAAMNWVVNHLGRDWLQRIIITERVDLVHGDVYVGNHVGAHAENELEQTWRLEPSWKRLNFSHNPKSSERKTVCWANILTKTENRATKLLRKQTSVISSEHKSPSGKRVVLIDQDNTFTDFNAKVIKIASGELHNFETQEQREQALQNKHSRVADNFTSQEHRNAVTSIYGREGFIRDLDPQPGAIDAIRRLHESYEVFLVTAPPKTAYAASEKIEWVEKHLGPEFVPRMVITDQKTLVFGDVIIDDAPDPLGTKSFKPSWVHFPFKQKWNEDLHKSHKRVDWTDAEQHLEQFYKVQEAKKVAQEALQKAKKVAHRYDSNTTFDDVEYLQRQTALLERNLQRSRTDISSTVVGLL